MATRRPTDFDWSLVILAGVVGFALTGLAFDGNWPKLVRVALAASTYAFCLLPVRRLPSPLSPAVFVCAGAAAGFVSGILRPDPRIDILAIQTVAAAVLIGPMHWLALRWHGSTHPHLVAPSSFQHGISSAFPESDRSTPS